MKILRISLKNIASLAGLHTVDFTREPLASSGLFAICGPTGSGKSTLLDALCLSLYERTPRLSAVKGAVKLPDGAEDKVSQKDPGNLLRRGTGEGFTEVAFCGVDGQTYTARWSIRRARNRPNGALQNTEVALFRGNIAPGSAGEVAHGGKRTEVLPVIAEKVGLSFEQFTRAVLLAQNDFATFLKASDTERAEILQALTGTERFEAISVAVYNRNAAENAEIEALESQSKGSIPLEADARETLESNVKAAKDASEEAVAQLEVRLKQQQWFVDWKALCSQVQQADDQVKLRVQASAEAQPRREALAQTERMVREARSLRGAELSSARAVEAADLAHGTASLKAKAAQTESTTKGDVYQSALNQYNQTEAAIKAQQPDLKMARELDAQLKPLAGNLERAREQHVKAQEKRQLAVDANQTKSDERTGKVRELDALGKLRQALEVWEPFVAESGVWIERLQQTAKANKASFQAEAEFKKLADAWSKRAASEKQALESRDARAVEASQLAEKLAELEADAKKYDSGKIAHDLKSNAAASLALQDLKQAVESLESFETQAVALQKELEDLERTNAGEEVRLNLLQTELLPQAFARSLQAKKSFELAVAAVDPATAGIREKLESGRECPVCGGTEHPYLSHAPTEEFLAVKALRGEAEAQEAAHAALRAEEAGLERSIAAAKKEFERKAGNKGKLLVALEAARAFTPSHEEARALWKLDGAARKSGVVLRLGEFAQVREKLEEQGQAARRAEALVQETRKAQTTADKALRDCEATYAEHSKDAALAKEKRDTAEQECAQKRSEHAASHKALTRLWSRVETAEREFERQPEAFVEKVREAIEKLSGLAVKQEGLTRWISEADVELKLLKQNLDAAEKELLAKSDEQKKSADEHDSIFARRASLLAGRPADEVEGEGQTLLRNTALERDKSLTAWDAAKTALTAAAAGLQGAAEVLGRAKAAHAAAAQSMADWLAAFVQATGRVLPLSELDAALLLEDAWFANERTALADLEAAINSARGVLKTRELGLAEHVEKRPTLEEETVVIAEIPDLNSICVARKTAAEHLRAALINDDQRREGSKELARQIAVVRLRAEPWGKLNELIGSADGAKFRNIAQRRTLDILLAYANEQLERLAARYRLQRIPQSLNLLVVDRDMADEQRSVHSLSGGESFLVSLALALGLASLTSNRLRIESLFIDEGFGSLDPETLTIATNALMHLQAQGRKVGVISHVAEMAEAIPVQIRVVKGHSGASRIEVPGA